MSLHYCVVFCIYCYFCATLSHSRQSTYWLQEQRYFFYSADEYVLFYFVIQFFSAANNQCNFASNMLIVLLHLYDIYISMTVFCFILIE